MVNLKRDLPAVISRDKTVDYRSRKGGRVYYTHTSMAQAMTAIDEPLTRHGFTLSWEPTTRDGKVVVTCKLTHTQGHAECSSLEAAPDLSGGKEQAQGIASTITLLSRYLALSMLGIATADMQEPTGQPEPTHTGVDANRVIKAIAAFRELGYTPEEMETQLGVKRDAWTSEHLNTLKSMHAELTTAKPAAVKQYDPETGEVKA
jgi:hypothetical protein